GVQTFDVYDYVLGSYGGELERLLSIGGDAAVRPPDQDQTANRFKPVVLHQGPFYLKKGQKAKHTLKIPNYVGSVRTMVVAVQDQAYGAADKTTPVRKPLMVLATLPRVLGPGETLRMPVNVFAMEEGVQNVEVTLSENSGLVDIQGSKTQSLRFSKTGDQLVFFDLRVRENVGVARFKVEAKSGKHQASQEIEIQVRNPNPYITEIQKGTVEKGAKQTFAYEPVGMTGTNSVVLEVSSLPPINLGERLEYLIHYPYGCIEQTLSSGFPQLYVDQVLDLPEKLKAQVPKNVQATVDRLKRFQTSQGGFAYWPGDNEINQWSNTYAGHFLLEARELGYNVPSNMIDRWKKYQKKIAQTWDPAQFEAGLYSRQNDELSQAYRLYTLALAKDPELGAMNRLREQRNLSDVAKWRLAAAYALTGQAEVARQIVQGASMAVADYRELSYTFGSALRDKAMILETLS
ncbi:MAG: alpha-2-macroglobulin, partial [Saprospiraceae bacterium]|nr:alpha-2-macroglobulin [Saprospiraceae bacterium]